MKKITKINFDYLNVKNIIKDVPFIRVVKDEESLLIIQTLDVSPFRELFYSNKEKGHKEDGVRWCFCIPKDNKSWGWFAEKSYKDFTRNGKNQQYIAFDFTKEYVFINPRTNQIYAENDVILNTDIRNCTSLILISQTDL